MNKILNKRVSFILLIIWLIVIFVFSNMDGATSSNLSKSIIASVSNVLSKDVFDFLHFLIRKLAHITEYFILCLLTYNYLRFYINKDHLLYLSITIFSFVCSIFDELHQLLINGREGKIVDIFIDDIGIIICLLVIIIYKKYASKRKSD